MREKWGWQRPKSHGPHLAPDVAIQEAGVPFGATHRGQDCWPVHYPSMKSWELSSTYPSRGQRGAAGLPARRYPVWPCPLTTPWQLGKEQSDVIGEKACPGCLSSPWEVSFLSLFSLPSPRSLPHWCLDTTRLGPPLAPNPTGLALEQLGTDCVLIV